MIVEVTKTDIRCGRRIRASACPVALAISRATGRKAIVDGDTVAIDAKDYALPSSVAGFVIDFDNGVPVKPFRFRMRRPA